MMYREQKVNVLLVDDHPENLLVLEAILGSLGQNLVRANSGEQALRCLLNQEFAVILLDVQMPGMDGFETATLIRQRQRSRDTPIIFLTAFSTSDNLVFQGYSLGAVDYLLKPIQPEVLKSKVAVFVDLFKKTAEVKRQAAQLEAINSELKESEQRFRALSTCSPVGIFLTDTAGCATYTNPRYQAIYGHQLGENLVEAWLQSVHPEDRDRIIALQSVWNCAEHREYADEFRLVVQIESIRWVHVQLSPLVSDKGKLIGHVGTVEDITERKQAEEARVQIIREQEARQQAEAANRMKDDFLATVSHELRTPLNSILGWTQLLRTRKFDPSTINRALEVMERNAKAQAQLIEDLLDVSRIIRGKLRLNFCRLNLVAIVETAIDTVRLTATNKSIELESVLEPSAVYVSGDPDRLQQVTWNLLSNAIKFTAAGGKVMVRLSVVSGEWTTDTEQNTITKYAQIQVIDTGNGISKDFLPYVFEPFRQADSTTTRAYGGLGLGLAIVQQLVEMHGGKIYVDSDGEGKGATFTVKLPLLEVKSEKVRSEKLEAHPSLLNASLGEEELHTQPPFPETSPLESLKILLVEDDTDTRDYIATVLQQYEAKVTAVASVSEALAALQQVKPDILVSDIGMPGEDGYRLIRQVKALETKLGEKIPVIALTAYASGDERLKAISAGFQMHASKPIEPAELIAVVAKLAGRNH